MSCEQDKDEAFWLSRDSREASSFFAIKVHVAIVRDSFTPACSYYVKFICWLVTIICDSFTQSCGYYVIPFVGSLP